MHLCQCGKRLNNRTRQCSACYHASPEHKARVSRIAKEQAVNPATRFWSKVHITDGCWNWQGGIDKDGYGEFRSGTGLEKGITRKAHRFAFWLANGYLPDMQEGHELDHICVNTMCVRFDHLRDVTRLTNLLRRDQSARQRDKQGRYA